MNQVKNRVIVIGAPGPTLNLSLSLGSVYSSFIHSLSIYWKKKTQAPHDNSFTPFFLITFWRQKPFWRPCNERKKIFVLCLRRSNKVPRENCRSNNFYFDFNMWIKNSQKEIHLVDSRVFSVSVRSVGHNPKNENNSLTSNFYFFSGKGKKICCCHLFNLSNIF